MTIAADVYAKMLAAIEPPLYGRPRKRAPKEVRCRFRFYRSHTIENQTITNVHFCDDCGGWTGNLPEYKYDVCPSKDRRKGVRDRRDCD